jgi:hypothetical protein
MLLFGRGADRFQRESSLRKSVARPLVVTFKAVLPGNFQRWSSKQALKTSLVEYPVQLFFFVITV